MSLRSIPPLLLIAGLAFAPAGCRVPWTQGEMPATSGLTIPTEVAPRFDKQELSPAEAARACIVTAEELEKAGHGREAIALYERARQHDPKAIPYARRLAVLYDQWGDATRARAEYTRALDQEPDNADLCNDAGYFHLQQGELEQAEKLLRRAIAEVPEHPRAWTNLGIVLAQQGRYRDSFEAFSRVAGAAAAHSNVGAILARQGRLEEAENAFRQALALNPQLPQPRAFLDRIAGDRSAVSPRPTPGPATARE